MITLLPKNLSFPFTNTIIPYIAFSNINTILNTNKYSQKHYNLSKYKYTFLPKINYQLYYNSYDKSFKNNYYNIFGKVKKIDNNNNIKSFLVKSKEWAIKNKKKIIVTSSFISIAFILFDVKLYLNRKKIEKKLQKKISEFLKDENPSLNYVASLLSQNYIQDNLKLLAKNFIENYNKNESKAISGFCNKILKNKISQYIKNRDGQKFFVELIKKYILTNIGEINIVDLYENTRKNKNSQDCNITDFLETCLIEVFSSKNFIDYISTNLLNELKFEIKPNMLCDEDNKNKVVIDKETEKQEYN